MARGRIRKPRDLPYRVSEWSEDEITYYNDEAISIDDRLLNKFIDAMNYNEGTYDYSLNDVYQCEDDKGNLIILIGGGSDMNAFKDMLNKEYISYEVYPFESYLHGR